MRRGRAGSRGVTLVELLVAVTLIGLTAVAGLRMTTAAAPAQTVGASAAVTAQSNVGIARMMEELRSAVAIQEATSTAVTAAVSSASGANAVAYTDPVSGTATTLRLYTVRYFYSNGVLYRDTGTGPMMATYVPPTTGQPSLSLSNTPPTAPTGTSFPGAEPTCASPCSDYTTEYGTLSYYLTTGTGSASAGCDPDGNGGCPSNSWSMSNQQISASNPSVCSYYGCSGKTDYTGNGPMFNGSNVAYQYTEGYWQKTYTYYLVSGSGSETVCDYDAGGCQTNSWSMSNRQISESNPTVCYYYYGMSTPCANDYTGNGPMLSGGNVAYQYTEWYVRPVGWEHELQWSTRTAIKYHPFSSRSSRYTWQTRTAIRYAPYSSRMAYYYYPDGTYSTSSTRQVYTGNQTSYQNALATWNSRKSTWQSYYGSYKNWNQDAAVKASVQTGVGPVTMPLGVSPPPAWTIASNGTLSGTAQVVARPSAFAFSYTTASGAPTTNPAQVATITVSFTAADGVRAQASAAIAGTAMSKQSAVVRAFPSRCAVDPSACPPAPPTNDPVRPDYDVANDPSFEPRTWYGKRAWSDGTVTYTKCTGGSCEPSSESEYNTAEQQLTAGSKTVGTTIVESGGYSGVYGQGNAYARREDGSLYSSSFGWSPPEW